MSELAGRYPLTPHPWGWFAVALSHQLSTGQVQRLEVLGRELVLLRTASGRAALLDPYCAHLGAHLGGGEVQDEDLVCPFHRWRWSAEGRCVAAPGAARLPGGARVRAWPTVERDGVVLFWHGPEAEPRPWFEPPELPPERWSPVRFAELILEVHLLEVAENGVDIAHFGPIHHCERAGATLIDGEGTPFRFDLRTSYPGDGIGVPGTRVAVTTRWEYWGPGRFVAVSTADDYGTRVRQVFHFTPVPGGRVHFRIAIQTDTTTVPADMLEMVQLKNEELTLQNLLEDAPIWRTKRYLARPVVSDADGPLGPLRRWVRPFYAEAAAPAAPAADELWPAERAEYGAPAKASAPARPAPGPAPADRAAVRASIVEAIPAAFDARAAGDAPFVVQYDITGPGGGRWHVKVADGRCAVADGEDQAASVRVTVSDADWLLLQAGELDRAKAFLAGRLKVSGNFRLAMRLDRVFPLSPKCRLV